MTLTTPYQASFYVGDGETKAFPFVFEELSDNFVKVIVSHIDGTISIPTYTVDLELKQVVFGDETPAPTADDVVCIYRETPTIQDTPFKTLEGYNAKALENILSKIVAMIQEIKSNYFSTQVLQGDPWQLDLLKSADDGATVNIDYVAKKLVKGLYFQITDGNLQVSADGSSYITMPKSTDVAEFRQNQIELPDHTYQYKLQYRVGSTWYDADVTAQNTADAAYSLASTVQADLSSHTNNQNNPHQTSVAKLTDTDINNPVLGHFLRFDGTKWVNSSSDVTSVDWGEIEGDITDQTDLQNALGAKVNIDGTSIMTAPLKFMSGSVRGAVGPYFNGVGFWKLDSQGNLTQIASISDSQFMPTTTNATDIGNSTKKWKDLYLGGKAYVGTLNNGYDISVPAYAGTMLVADFAGATAGQFLALDSNLKPVWANVAKTLPDLSDVEITSASNGQVLTYNGSKWINQAAQTPIINFSINGGNFVAGSGTYALSRFCLMLQKPDGTWEKPTDTSVTYSEATDKTVNTNGFLLNQIMYYNNTGATSSGQVTGLNKVYSKHSNVPMSYSTNCGTAPGWTLGTYFYLVGTLGADGLFYLDTTQWWATALPNTNDGKLYIRLGPVSSSTSSLVALLEDRPIFYHDGTGIKEYHPVDKNIANWSNNVTNCITEIPQDIKLELNNGTLTLKAGSKIYIPNGFEQDGTTPKFDVVITDADITYTYDVNGTYYIVYEPEYYTLARCSYPARSGSTAPELPFTGDLWYDTANNLCKRYSGTWVNKSFPIAIIKVSNGAISSIDQVFNGLGYVGSTIFAFPGIKGLIPNGRNSDGTLKNIPITLSSVTTHTANTTGTNNVVILSNGSINIAGIDYWTYNEYKNTWVHDNNTLAMASIAKSIHNTKITSFTPKTVFRALDYSDTEYIAHQAMPSNKLVDLTLGVSGTSYTAPADGWFCLNKTASGSQYACMQTQYGLQQSTYGTNGMELQISIPITKGDTVYVYYNAGGTTNRFRFYYANGAK